MRLALIVGLALVTGSVARADVQVDFTELGDPTTSTGATAPTFRALLMTVRTTAGEKITAIDVGGTSAANPRGLFGSLLQRAVLDPDEGSRTLTPGFLAQRNNATGFNSFDSHFLTLPAGSTVAPAAQPSEDNTGTNPPGSPADTSTSDYGTGTFLKSTYGITGTQPEVLDLAYLVIPDGAPLQYSINVATLSLTGQAATVERAGLVPEPSGLALVGLGALATLWRRRRSA